MISLEKTLAYLAKSDRCPPRSKVLPYQKRFTRSTNLMKIPAGIWVLFYDALRLGELERYDSAAFRTAAKGIFNAMHNLPQNSEKTAPLAVRRLDDEEVQMLLLSVRCAQLGNLDRNTVLFESWWLPTNLAAHLPEAKTQRKGTVKAHGQSKRLKEGKRLRRPSTMGLKQISGTKTEIVVINNKLALKTIRIE